MCFVIYRIVKLLVWDHDGFVINGKRLEKGSFEYLTKLTKGKKQAGEYLFHPPPKLGQQVIFRDR